MQMQMQMQTSDRSTTLRWPVILGMVLPLLLVGTVTTGVWLFDHGHSPIARHDKPGTDAGKARDSIQIALQGAAGLAPRQRTSRLWLPP
ncbi:hypothetical protein AB0A71_30190 [Kitasatospora aureofaciens]|uniref:hypothetical protein n=1 Tax=Kitasatospora aureofaciens TaxID=1894 RepID=UPI0033F413E2